ncbi:10530_t:CDS:2, partial [Gigaspora rosea]
MSLGWLSICGHCIHQKKRGHTRFNSNISLVELAEVLNTNINEESKKAKFVYWKTQILLTSSAITLPQALFPEVDNALRYFLTPAMLKVQRDEIKSCLNYQASAITEDELIGFQE